jgi:dephospho-CoA kinase
MVNPFVTVLVAIGYKCAGKTTFAEYLATREGVRMFEGSAAFRSLAADLGRDIASPKAAIEFLTDRGMDAVAREIASHVDNGAQPINVVSGIRTIEDLLFFRRKFPCVQVVWVDADARLRFERHLARGRDREITTLEAFKAQDEEQQSFGVMRVAPELADTVVINDASMLQYQRKIDDVLVAIRNNRAGRASRRVGERHRALRALATFDGTATCEEIAAASEAEGDSIRKCDINRGLKSLPEFAEPIFGNGDRRSYRMTPRGRLLLELLEDGMRQ